MESLQNERGDWIEGLSEVKSLAVSFYTGLFAADPYISGEFITGLFLPISEGD